MSRSGNIFRNRVITIIVLTLMSISVCTNVSKASCAMSSLTVHNVNTGLGYATIGEAIDDPKTLRGHMIKADAGTYYERVTIYKDSLILLGENSSTTIIDSESIGDAVHITASHVVLSGFTIRKAGSAGVYLDGSSNTIITENTIRDNAECGVYADSSTNSTIRENDIIHNSQGVSFSYSTGCTVYHNNLLNNTVQATNWISTTAWDNGYPSGGNYWSNYDGTDLCRGPHQNLSRSDGIGDTAHVIDTINRDSYPLMKTWIPPDIAVMHLAPYKTLFTPGYPLPINVSFTNQGNKIEGFNVTIYANTTLIQRGYLELNKNNSITMTFAWNTVGLAEYKKYTVHAYVEPLQGEIDLSDNTLSYSSVTTAHEGDVNGDRRVDIQDVARVCGAFGSYPGKPKWNPLYDINTDRKVDIQDLARTSKNFGWRTSL